MNDKRCSNCEFYKENRGVSPVRTKKGMMQPMGKYCLHQEVKFKKLTNGALGIYGYPVWCPIANERVACEVCGTRIRSLEEPYCKSCRRELN